MPQPGEGAPGAFYMTITGGAEDDRIVGAESPGCGETVIHESVEDDEGMMMMQHVEGGIPVAAGSEVVLEPGGLHLMCLEPTDALVVGESVPLTVAFAEAGNIETEALVEER